MPDKERLEVFALWLMINQQSENQGNRISSELLEEAYGPEQLSDENYPPATFNFLLLLTYSLEIFNFEPYLTFEKIHRNQFSEGVKKWIELFEKNIRMLSKIEKEYFFHAFYKNDVVHNIIDYQNDIKQVIQKFDSRSFQNQTYFYRVFEELWQDFACENSELSKECDKELLADLSYQLILEESLIPTVKFFWHSGLSKRVLNRLEKNIQLELRNRANIIFISNEEQADIQIATEPTEKGISIMVPPTQKDFRYLEKVIESFLEQA